jgi:peptidoglycan/xylan/chitin deacetylase (PgdA/CDA1 family)
LKPMLPRKRLELTSGPIDLTPPGAIEQLSLRMERRWHSQRLESYLPFTRELLEMAARERRVTLSGIRPPAPIAWQEVTELSKSDLIRFESHGVSHAAMSSLTDEELTFEMKHSRDVVTEHTGRLCRHLAYPFGNSQSIGARAVTAAGRFYDSAVTMTLGHVHAANPWLMPRIPLYVENSRMIGRMKILLYCSKISSVRSP